MRTYAVYRGEYPFDQLIGFVHAPADQPEIALNKAINDYRAQDLHPVVELMPGGSEVSH